MRLLTAPIAGLAVAACAVSGLAGCTEGGSTPTAANSAQVSAAAASTGHPGPGVAPTASATAGAAPTASTAAGVDWCRSLVVPASVKAAVTRVYGPQSVSWLVHIAPVPGTFYYGRCGSVYYAATRFEPTNDATEREDIAMQDEGAAMQYFSRAATGGWRHIVADMATTAPRGCSVIKQIPAQLAQLWDNCRAGELPW